MARSGRLTPPFAPGRRCGCLFRSFLSLFRYAALRGGGSLDHYVVQRGCALSRLAVFVARRKRSAPAKHPVRGAEYATGVCSITVAQSGRLAPPTRVPLSLVSLALSLRRATGCSPMRIVGDSPVARCKRLRTLGSSEEW